MLASERQQQILSRLEENGTVRTMDLAKEFAVTDETIRRDLQTLAETYPINRVHGGASSISGRPKLQSFTERRAQRVEEKQAIAKAALDDILPDKTYAFDSSTTVNALVALLPDAPLRVVTNAYAVLDQLVGYEHVDLISTGGRYHPKTHTFTGAESLDTLHRHHIHTAFLSCIGFDARRGASEGFEQQAVFKEHLVRMAESVCLLADSSKLGELSEYYFADVRQVDRLITDERADAGIVADLISAGVEVVLAPLSTPTPTSSSTL